MPVRAHGKGWQIRFQHRGQIVARTVRGSKTEAQQEERALRARLERGAAPGAAERRTLEDVLARWLDGEARALRSHADAVAKSRHWIPWAARPIGQTLDAVAEAKKTWLDAGLNVATINRRIAALRRAYNVAFRDGWIAEPIGARIRSLAGERPRYVQLTIEQARELLDACEHPRVRDAIRLYLLTGLRPSELLTIDPARNLARDTTGTPTAIILDAKNKTGVPGMIPLTPEAATLAATLPLGITAEQIRYAFERARLAAGMPWLQLRDLRRTFGSWIVQETGNLKAAQDLLRHTTPSITARHYGHLLPRHLAGAVATLPQIQTGQETGQNRNKQSKNTRKKAA